MNKYKIKKIKKLSDALEIHWQDGFQAIFHYIWLRDNDARTQVSIGQNSNDILGISLDIKPVSVSVQDTLDIVWDADGAISHIDLAWLREHSYTPAEKSKQQCALTYWKATDFMKGLTYYNYQELVQDKHIMRNMLQHCRDFGFAILHNVPNEEKMVLEVLKHFGYPRVTHHNTLWDITLKPASEDIGYRNSVLPGHVDQPYRRILPTMTLLHFMANNVAQGDSTLVDGFYLAEQLRQHHPTVFHLLSTRPVTYLYRDDETELCHEGTIIELDSRGQVIQVRMNSFSIQPFDMHPDDMLAFYRAYQTWGFMMQDPVNQLTVKLDAGQILILDNLRILHGRLGYTNTQDAERHVQGCFSDQDDFWSKLAVLNRNLGVNKA